MSFRDWFSVLIGLLVLAVGIIPLLSTWKIIAFTLPAFLDNIIVAIIFWVIALGGLFVVVDGLIEPAGHFYHTALIILGIIFVVAGLIPILIKFLR